MGSSSRPYRGERTPLLRKETEGDSIMARKTTFYKIFFNAFTFVVLFTISSLAITTSSGYLSSVLSTVEQRFQLKSAESSLLFTVDDAVSFSTVLIVTHFGNSANKPKIISCLFLLVAIGTVLQTVPHFLYEPPGSFQPSQGGRGGGGGGGGRGGGGGNGGRAQPSDQYLCDNSSFVIDNCSSTDTMNSGALWYQVWWIYFGKALAGFGISTHPLAITYLDDSPARSHLPIFIAIIYGFRSTGSSIGGFIAQQCLSVPYSWPSVTSHTVTNPNDPQYLGAWWLGLIPIAAMAFCPSVLLFFFPRVMTPSGDSETAPDKSDVKSDTKTLRGRGRGRRGRNEPNNSRSGDTNTIAIEESSSKVRRILNAIIGFFRALFRVMRNWVVLSLMFADHALSFSSFPDGTYAAKYLQYQFHLSAAEASALRSWTKLPMIFVGYFFSAFIIMTGRLKPRGTIIMVAVCIVLAALLTPAKLYAGCENNPIAGLTVPYDYTDVVEDKNAWSARDRNLTATCNADCYCPSGYNPVCAPSGVSYATACHAGCKDTTIKMKDSKNVTVYTHCSCYDELFPNATDEEDTLSDGICAADCTWVYHFILLMLTSLLRNIMYSPSLMSKVRVLWDLPKELHFLEKAIGVSLGLMWMTFVVQYNFVRGNTVLVTFVDEQDRSMIQGFDKFIKRFLVTAPGPVVYGILFDKSCLLFQLSCGKTGNCLVYDIERLRILLFGVATAFATVSAIAAFLTLFLVFCRTKRENPRTSETQVIGSNTNNSNSACKVRTESGAESHDTIEPTTEENEQGWINYGAFDDPTDTEFIFVETLNE